MMSPDEALKNLKELREDLEIGWVDIYGNDDVDIEEALIVAIAALEEKDHE